MLADDRDDVAIAAVTVAELLVGVELGDERRRPKRAAFVEAVLELPIEEYGIEVARAHAALLAYVRLSGTSRGAHDLMIAATAVASQRIVVTTDTTGFKDLPGVSIRLVERGSR